MISFRYHIVSIVGIFLALALGIVIGTTALNGPITKDLRNQVNSVKGQRDTLAASNKTLQGQVADAGKFASTYGARLVAGSLTKQSVVLISLPGADGLVSGVSQQLTNAGATIAGRVTIGSPYLNASNGNGIDSLATGSVRPIGWTAPPTSDPRQLGGSLLAYVLTGKGQRSDLSQVLGAFSELHMVSANSAITSATNIVVVGAGSVGSYPASAELALVSALAADSAHVVVAGDGPSAGRVGLVGLVRNTSSIRSEVSTVDDADTAFGQVSAALALANSIKGESGQYGTQDGADALFPTPPS